MQCPNVNSCDIHYTAIPAGKTFIMQHTSCTMQVGGNQPIANLSVRSQTQSAINFLTVAQVGATTNAGVRTFHMNDTVQVIVLAGQVPQVHAEVASPNALFVVRCFISGQLLP